MYSHFFLFYAFQPIRNPNFKSVFVGRRREKNDYPEGNRGFFGGGAKDREVFDQKKKNFQNPDNLDNCEKKLNTEMCGR